MLFYFVGMLLGTICMNVGFDITELSYVSSRSLCLSDYAWLLLIRGTEVSVLIFLLHFLPNKWARGCLLVVAGCVAGGWTSVRACTGTWIQTFLFGWAVLLIVICYMSTVEIALETGGGISFLGRIPIRHEWIRRTYIVTILLLTCALELKILKFF